MCACGQDIIDPSGNFRHARVHFDSPITPLAAVGGVSLTARNARKAQFSILRNNCRAATIARTGNAFERRRFPTRGIVERPRQHSIACALDANGRAFQRAVGIFSGAVSAVAAISGAEQRRQRTCFPGRAAGRNGMGIAHRSLQFNQRNVVGGAAIPPGMPDDSLNCVSSPFDKDKVLAERSADFRLKIVRRVRCRDNPTGRNQRAHAAIEHRRPIFVSWQRELHEELTPLLAKFDIPHFGDIMTTDDRLTGRCRHESAACDAGRRVSPTSHSTLATLPSATLAKLWSDLHHKLAKTKEPTGPVVRVTWWRCA